MIPEVLKERASIIFAEMGGYTEAQQYLPDSDIIDIATASNPTIILNMSRAAFFNQSVGRNAVEDEYGESFALTEDNFVEAYNLEDFGYIPGSTYQILDRELQLKYTAESKVESFRGVLGYYFGTSAKDLEFVRQAEHGELYYIHFYSLKGPVLIYLVINNLPNPQEFEGYRKRYEALVAQQTATKYYEVNIITYELPDLHYFELCTMPGRLQQDLAAIDVYIDPQAQVTKYAGGEDIYIKTSTDLWIALVEVRPVAENLVDLLTGQYLERALEILEDRNFGALFQGEDGEIGTKFSRIVFRKLRNDSLEAFGWEEVILTVDLSGLVDKAEHKLSVGVELRTLTVMPDIALIGSRRRSYFADVNSRLTSSRNTLNPSREPTVRSLPPELSGPSQPTEMVAVVANVNDLLFRVTVL